MGYDLHITRTDEWFDSESSPVTVEEWRAYVAADSEMAMPGYAEAKGEGHVLRYENEDLAVWTVYSKHGKDGNMAWFDDRDGRIVVKNPDQEIIAKMTAIARHLRANVFGDDGESYSATEA